MQTYRDFEILLINDYSDEKCKEALEELSKQDTRINLYHLPERTGVGAARKFGIKKAKGDFISFLDGDDHLGYKT